jgi:hypothetical protein
MARRRQTHMPQSPTTPMPHVRMPLLIRPNLLCLMILQVILLILLMKYLHNL